MASNYAPNAFNGTVLSGNNRFSRRWGSNNSDVAVDPYITGYHFIKFQHFPNLDTVLSEVATQYDSVTNVLESLVTSVTIPGATVNKAEFQGLGGIRWFYPTNVDWDNTITLKFWEMSGTPVHSIIHAWVKMIGDYRAGVTRAVPSVTGKTPTKSDISASMYYWTTKPDGFSVSYHSLATGMFPTKDPTDMFGHDLTAIDKLELDIDFSVDVLYHEGFTRKQCQALASTYSGAFTSGKPVVTYMNDDASPDKGTPAPSIKGSSSAI